MQGLLRQDALDGSLGRPAQGRVSGRDRVPAHMLGQRLSCPQFRRAPEILRLRAGQMYHPSFGGWHDHRFPGPMVGILQARRQAHPQGFADQLATLVRVMETWRAIAAMVSPA